LLESIANSNFDQIKTEAHKLNGAAGNFGFERLCGILGEMEVAAIDSEKISATLVGQFKTAFSESTTALNLYMTKQVVTLSQTSSIS
jgi:HPt (histidine-containing phosphotransfer) domain-containing protein